jgi:hypothetical protein
MRNLYVTCEIIRPPIPNNTNKMRLNFVNSFIVGSL